MKNEQYYLLMGLVSLIGSNISNNKIGAVALGIMSILFHVSYIIVIVINENKKTKSCRWCEFLDSEFLE